MHIRLLLFKICANMNPHTYHLTRIRWQFFGTLTFSRIPPLYVRKACICEYLRRIAKSFCAKDWKWDLFYAVRHEYGELTGRAHFHFLLTVPKSSPNIHSARHTLKSIWQDGVGGCAGFADIRLYDPRLSGADYIMKGTDWCLAQANAYELAKFIDTDLEQSLIVSPSVIWELHKRVTKHWRRKDGVKTARLLRMLKERKHAHGATQSYWQPERFIHPADPTAR